MIPYQSVVESRHIVNQPEFTISLSRSLSKVKQLYFVLVANAGNPTRDFKQRVQTIANFDFATDLMAFQAHFGSQKFSDNECVGAGESYFRLLQACGHEKDNDDIAIQPAGFVGGTAIFGIDFEKAGNEALFSGINTKDGKVMTLHVKNSQVTPAKPHTVYVFQIYDGVCNVRRAAVDVEE